MNQDSRNSPNVVVIGGGITGLAAAHRISESQPDAQIALFEAADRLGGVLRTERRGGYLLESSADNFITAVPWAINLCNRIGFADQLLPTNKAKRRALIACGKRLYPVPEGFLLMEPRRLWPLVTTPLLSVRGKLRILAEYFVPAQRNIGDESLASFARRRLGRESYERLVQPLVGGIYTADADRLSLRATLPRFVEMERDYGGLIRAARRNRVGSQAGSSDSGARYGMFIAPRDGMSSLVDALAARLPAGAVQLGVEATSLTQTPDGRWQVSIRDAEPLDADAVIVALPAPRAATLVADLDSDLCRLLAGVEHAGTAIALLAYRRDQIARPVDGFGFVVPEIERRPIISGSFSSEKFPGRAPDDRVLIRVFLGGAARPDLVDASDEEVRRIATTQLGELLGAAGEPELFEVVRWRGVMPQYHVGHMDRVEEIETSVRRWPRLALAGNAYHGVGIPNCIHSGEQAADRVLAALASAPLTRP